MSPNNNDTVINFGVTRVKSRAGLCSVIAYGFSLVILSFILNIDVLFNSLCPI